MAPLLDPEAEVYAALVLGTRDYVEKNGFGHVVIGLSGGIDSTLTLLVAVDALGTDRVTAVTMPSRYSSSGTRDDAKVLAGNLAVELHEIAIGPAMEVYEQMLGPIFGEREPDITEENLQARIRGNLLMALSNKFGWLVLTTGNKSENSVGYSTLYGDSAGGFAVIKDVPKTLVYRLTEWRNAQADTPPVPRSVIDRPPSAELRDDQKDSDSLGDYDTLDAILEAYVEEDQDPEQIERAGQPADAIERVRLARRPRRVQAPPGPSGDQDHAARVRARPPDADHQRLPAAAARAQASLTATVIRTRAHRRSSSSVMSTSQTHVVRPLWRRRAVAWTVPPTIGRRKLVWLDRPCAVLPSSCTASQVATEVSDSAIEANTPPCTSPAGWSSSSRTRTCARASSSPISSTSSPYSRSKPTGKPSNGVVTGRGTLPWSTA